MRLGMIFLLAVRVAAADLSDAEKEAFLRTAAIETIEPVARGVTGSRRAVLVDAAGFRHDAHVQSVNRPAVAGRDYFGFNIAAYRLDRLLGFGLVPVSVEREVEGRPAAVTWWIDDYLMLEVERWKARRQPPDLRSWNRRMLNARVLTELVGNTDANLGNIVIDRAWRTWLIDFTRAFGPTASLRKPNELIRIDRELLGRLRSVATREIAAAVGEFLTPAQQAALESRRGAIVRHFDALAAAKGESAVFFEAP
jgi:hypothetical protein